MAEQSIAALVRDVLSDARELIRGELALVRSEVREEASSARAAAVSFGAAGLAAATSAVLLSLALGGAAADLFGWPVYAGHGLVAILLGASAYACIRHGRRRAAAIRALPRTVASIRENLEWIQQRSNSR
jgi:hypothetical protein